MKIENKHWIIIAIVVILIALWYFFIKKKPATTSNYAGMYGSFGNESNFKKDPCANHTCPSGCTKVSVNNGKCGCKCPRQGTASGFVWA